MLSLLSLVQLQLQLNSRQYSTIDLNSATSNKTRVLRCQKGDYLTDFLWFSESLHAGTVREGIEYLLF